MRASVCPAASILASFAHFKQHWTYYLLFCVPWEKMIFIRSTITQPNGAIPQPAGKVYLPIAQTMSAAWREKTKGRKNFIITAFERRKEMLQRKKQPLSSDSIVRTVLKLIFPFERKEKTRTILLIDLCY